MIVETLLFTTDKDGGRHFANDYRPRWMVIDRQGLPWGKWLEVDDVTKTITITLDGESVVYRRVAKDIHDRWVCERVGGDAHDDVRRGSREV